MGRYRSRRWLVALAVCGVSGCTSDSEPKSAADRQPGKHRASGTWRELPDAPNPNSGYQELTAVRVGQRVVVIAGVDYKQSTLKMLVLDRSGKWLGAVQSGLWWRYSYSAVRARGEVIVFGGCCGPGGPGSRAAGAAYDPFLNRWRILAPGPLGNRFGHSAIWTGDEMIIWGGVASSIDNPTVESPSTVTGAAYDPRADSWRQIPPAPLPPRDCHAAVWTGEEMIVWGGAAFGCGHTGTAGFRSDGAAFDPARNRWRQIAEAPITSGAGAEHEGPEAVWSGEEMIVWNGYRAAAYDPRANSWRRLKRPISQARDSRGHRSVVWTGREMVVWGGGRAEGAALDPRRGAWRPIPVAPIPGRVGQAAVWTSEGMVVFGGCCRESRYVGDAAVYRPPRAEVD